MGWKTLKAGERLTAIDKQITEDEAEDECERQGGRVLGVITITAVTVEPLDIARIEFTFEPVQTGLAL